MKKPASTTTFLPRDCYSGYELRRLLGQLSPEGDLIPITRATLWHRRRKGQLPFVRFTARLVMYPRTLIDQMLREACSTAQS